jgi:hypothetical protein
MNVCKPTSIGNLMGSGDELKKLGSIPGRKKKHFPLHSEQIGSGTA